MQNEQIYGQINVNKECLSFVSILNGSSKAFFFVGVDDTLEDLRDDLSDPVAVLLTLIVGSFLGESDVDRASAHHLDLAVLSLSGQEEFSLDGLLNVHEG